MHGININEDDENMGVSDDCEIIVRYGIIIGKKSEEKRTLLIDLTLGCNDGKATECKVRSIIDLRDMMEYIHDISAVLLQPGLLIAGLAAHKEEPMPPAMFEAYSGISDKFLELAKHISEVIKGLGDHCGDHSKDRIADAVIAALAEADGIVEAEKYTPRDEGGEPVCDLEEDGVRGDRGQFGVVTDMGETMETEERFAMECEVCKKPFVRTVGEPSPLKRCLCGECGNKEQDELDIRRFGVLPRAYPAETENGNEVAKKILDRMDALEEKFKDDAGDIDFECAWDWLYEGLEKECAEENDSA